MADLIAQIRWERDIAIQQLKELGYGLGEKIRTDGDTISRQAAIDALGDEPEVWTGKDEYAQGLNNQWHYDRNAINAVPSAQPEIIRCKDCSRNYGSQHNPMCDFLDAHLWPDSFCSYAERRTDG